MIRKVVLLFIMMFPIFYFAQKQGNIWYFGNHAGLDFSSGTPVVITNGATTYTSTSCAIEGTSVICDSTGSLLFYTNGQQVWNKTQQIMPNGDSLLGNNSSTQAALIVPQPGSSRYFYLFTTDDFCNDNLKYGFRYSVVDICLDNGLGDVITNQKNILLLDTVAEKLTGVRHANGSDYWIIVHKYFSNAFYSYHLSSVGIVGTVVSHIGSVHPSGMIGVGGAIGELKASPDGNKLAIVNGQAYPNVAEYFNFDKNTGIVSDCVSVQTNPNYSYYGVSFSPDNSKLYISCWLNNIGVYQFNLNAGGGNADSVKASMTQLTPPTSSAYAMQLAVNGKIYLSRAGSPNNYLSAINNPNNVGVNCNYQDSAILLNPNMKTNNEGLPNFVDSYSYSNTTYNCALGVNEINKNSEIKIFPNPASNAISLNITNVSEFKNSTISIQNVLGEEIKKLSFKENIDVSDLSKGCYFLQITLQSGEIYQTKFIKQ